MIGHSKIKFDDYLVIYSFVFGWRLGGFFLFRWLNLLAIPPYLPYVTSGAIAT